MIDYSKLETLAKAATPGPWQQHLVDDTTVTSTTLDVCCTFPDGGRNDDVDFAAPVEQHEANAAYIAAANPQVIISLIARVKELEEALKPLLNEKAITRLKELLEVEHAMGGHRMAAIYELILNREERAHLALSGKGV